MYFTFIIRIMPMLRQGGWIENKRNENLASWYWMNIAINVTFQSYPMFQMASHPLCHVSLWNLHPIENCHYAKFANNSSVLASRIQGQRISSNERTISPKVPATICHNCWLPRNTQMSTLLTPNSFMGLLWNASSALSRSVSGIVDVSCSLWKANRCIQLNQPESLVSTGTFTKPIDAYVNCTGILVSCEKAVDTYKQTNTS
jgi:hypothetical protein